MNRRGELTLANEMQPTSIRTYLELQLDPKHEANHHSTRILRDIPGYPKITLIFLNTSSRLLGLANEQQTRGQEIKPILKEVNSYREDKSAICVQRFDDSLNSAIRITYRISLRSSSLREPRYPSLKVVLRFVYARPKPL